MSFQKDIKIIAELFGNTKKSYYLYFIKTVNTMKTFRKKPVQITAVQLTHENLQEVLVWANSIQPADKQVKESEAGILIPTKEGEMLCGFGDYLIKEPFPTDDRMFYPCKADMFDLTYEEVK